jgi:hypothetical protein
MLGIGTVYTSMKSTSFCPVVPFEQTRLALLTSDNLISFAVQMLVVSNIHISEKILDSLDTLDLKMVFRHGWSRFVAVNV